MTKYEIIDIAYKSRLFFNTEGEYRELWGVSFETVSDHRDDPKAVGRYYDILDKWCRDWIAQSLEEIVEEYSNASEVYLNLNWEGRSQMALRKRFCRMLFRIAATRGRSLSQGEKEIFRYKDGDDNLTSEFFPEGKGEPESISVSFVLLFAFDIVRPGRGTSGKGRDIRKENVRKSLTLFEDLIKLLREDMPTLGSTSKPIAFDETLENIRVAIGDSQDLILCSPLWFYYQLEVVKYACLSIVDMDLRRSVGHNLVAPDLPGIWIDDKDGGKSRFWIFPHNLGETFCYNFNHEKREIDLYPVNFSVATAPSVDQLMNGVIISAKGVTKVVCNPDGKLERSEIATMQLSYLPEEGRVEKVMFEKSSGENPEWFDWNCFRRLDPGSEQYKEISLFLRDLYGERSTVNINFRNHGRLFTDIVNNLIGRDREYLYIYDYAKPSFKLIEREGMFYYKEQYNGEAPSLSLFDLELSEEHPLYLLPTKLQARIEREDREYEKRFTSAVRSERGDKHERPSAWMRRLAELMSESENIANVSLINSPTRDLLLYFHDFDMTIPIDVGELVKYGGRKITGRVLQSSIR
ncbi:MAG: hypothetical protein K2M45_08460 [Muribaculaceae bacterium]|nr:hypothetical protein [Muribaculaceae bacterium]